MAVSSDLTSFGHPHYRLTQLLVESVCNNILCVMCCVQEGSESETGETPKKKAKIVSDSEDDEET